MKYLQRLLIWSLIAPIFVACDSDDDNGKDDKKITGDNASKIALFGRIQKGPAVKGDTVTVVALDGEMKATGDSVTTVVTDDDGSYNLTEGQVDTLGNPKNVEVKFDGKAFSEETGQVQDSTSVSAVVQLSDSTSTTVDTANVNTITDAVSEEIKATAGDVDVSKVSREVITTVLEALEITDSTIVNYYADPSKIDLNKDGVLYALSLVFKDDLKKNFLDPYKDIEKSAAPKWLSDHLGEGARQMFESLKKYKEYAEEKGIQKPEIDVTSKSFAAIIKSVLKRDAADGLGSLSFCTSDFEITSADTLSSIKTKFKALNVNAEDVDNDKFKFHRLSGADMTTLSKYFLTPCATNEGIRVEFVVQDRVARRTDANTIENIRPMLTKGAVYAGTHALGTEVTK